MKREKLRSLIHDVLAERAAIPDRPITVDTLTVDFVSRKVTFRGQTIYPKEGQAISYAVLSTGHLIVTKDGSDVI